MRIIYRFVEFSQGTTSTNPILTHEGYTYGLDALPMLLAVLVINVIHPGLILKGPDSDFPRQTRKEKRAIKREKKEAKQRERNEKRSRKEAHRQVELDNKLGINPQAEAPAVNRGGQSEFASYTVGEYQEFDNGPSRVHEV
jgi:hypothetical protein